MTVTSGQVSVGSSAVALAPVETGALPGPTKLVVKNTSGTDPVHLGGAGVTSAVGFTLGVGEQITVELTHDGCRPDSRSYGKQRVADRSLRSMAIGDDYATDVELKSYLGITDASDDAELADALASTSRGIETFCQRQFNQVTAASVRTFPLRSTAVAYVDDFHTVTDLVVEIDGDGDGTYATVTEFDLEPRDGVVNGVPGWPFSTIRFHDPLIPVSRRASVRVTAQWGWAAVPAPVHQACLIVAAETFKLKDAPFGVAGFGDFGVVRVRNNPLAASKLAPYVRDPVLVA